MPSGRLLDLGCGAKPYEPLFANPYTGIDVQAVHGRPDCCAIAERLPISDGSFAVVLSTQQLEHVEDPALVLSEAHRVLQRDGVLLLSTHGVWPYHPDPHDYWRWTEEGLDRLITDAGFEVDRIHRQGGLTAVIALLALYPLGGVAAKSRLLRPLARGIISIVNSLAGWLDPAVERLLPRHYASPSYLVVARRR